MDQAISLPNILANLSVPWMWQFHKIAFLVSIPGMLLESMFVRRISEVTFRQALAASLTANLISALLGFPMAWALRPFYHSLMVFELAGFLLPFAMFYILSVFIESHVFHRMELTNPLRASAIANLFSHILIVAMIMFTGYAML
jgi:ABC-type spermidine/putrescine transport system permease subunit I